MKGEEEAENGYKNLNCNCVYMWRGIEKDFKTQFFKGIGA